MRSTPGSVLAASVALIGSALSITSADAQTTDWTGATGNWFNAANWSSGIPGSGTSQTSVVNGGAAQIGAAANAGNALSIGGGSTVELVSGGSLAVGPGGITFNNGSFLTHTDASLNNNVNLAGPGTFNLANGAILTLNGVISGPGSLALSGPLGSNAYLSAANTYTGATTVSGSLSLEVTGSIASSSSLSAGSGVRVFGSGVLPSTTINNGAELHTSSVGVAPLAVNGNLTFGATATFGAKLAASTSDRVNVGGTATLGGTLDALSAGSAYLPGQYTVLTSVGAIAGTFGTFTSPVGGFSGLTASYSQDAHNVFVTLTAPFASTRWTGGSSNWNFFSANWSNGIPNVGTPYANIANGATVRLTAITTLPNTNLVIANGSTLDLQAFGTLTAKRISVGTGATLLLSGSTAVTAPIDLEGGTLRATTTGTLNTIPFLTDITVLGTGGQLLASAGKTLTIATEIRLGTQPGAVLKFGSLSDTGTIQVGGVGADLGMAIEVNGGTLRDIGATTSWLTFSTRQAPSTTVAAGATLDFNDHTTALRGISNLLGGGNVVIGTNPASQLPIQNGNFSGVISGAGGLLRSDLFFLGAPAVADLGHVLTLSGTNTYTGATTINGGTLIVNGSIAASSGVTVNNGGTLGGNGTVPSVTINSGALAPGNSIGLITVNGNLVLGAGAIYLVEVSPTSADRTNVTGTAQLGGELRLMFQPGTYSSNSYTILSASGGRTNTFNTVTTQNLPAMLSADVQYTSTDVLLVTLSSQIAKTLSGMTPNQKAVAGAQDLAFNGGLPSILALYNLPLAQLPAALDQLSGEVHVSTASSLIDESLYVRSAILGRLRAASYGGDMGAMAALNVGGMQAFADGEEQSGALAYAKSPIVTKAPPLAPRPTGDVVFWGQGFGAWGRFNTDGNAATLRRDLAGFITGVDTRVGGNGRLGIAAGYSGSRNNVEGRGSANLETGHVAAYGSWGFGGFNLRAGGAYAFHTIATDRTIAFPGFFDRAFANYEGNTGQVFGEVGYGFAFANLAFEPFAGAAWVRVHTDGATERATTAGLNITGTTFETGYATLGVRAASIIPLGDGMTLIPRGTVAWQHAFDSVTPSSVLAFQLAPNVPFTISGVPIARDSLLAEAGLDLAINPRATIGISYVGQIASNVQDHGAKGKFSWKF